MIFSYSLLLSLPSLFHCPSFTFHISHTIIHSLFFTISFSTPFSPCPCLSSFLLPFPLRTARPSSSFRFLAYPYLISITIVSLLFFPMLIFSSSSTCSFLLLFLSRVTIHTFLFLFHHNHNLISHYFFSVSTDFSLSHCFFFSSILLYLLLPSSSLRNHILISYHFLSFSFTSLLLIPFTPTGQPGASAMYYKGVAGGADGQDARQPAKCN